MTWYWNEERIGDHYDLARYMLDAVSTGSMPEADSWARAFREYMNDTFTAMEVLEEVENGSDYDGFFVDWAEDMAREDPDFDSVYGFEWRDEE